MPTQEQLLEQISVLQAAIATGALKVKYADKEVEYRTLLEMQQILNQLQAEAGLIDPKKGARKYSSFSKGYNCE